jgi:hypothetical protein
MLRYVLIWFALLVVAVANGALRQGTFGKVLPELRAHQLSTLIGSVAIGVVVWIVVQVWPPTSEGEAVRIGLVWVCLTVAFETFMGTVLLRQPIRRVLSDYDVTRGRVWPLFLVWLAIAPWLFLKLK